MLQRLIAIVLMIWLPLQGVAAHAMPFCKHAPGNMQTETAVQPHHAPAGHDMADHGDHGKHGATVPDPGVLDCNDCGLCHLACAGFLPAGTVLAFQSPADGLRASAPSPLISTPPERLFRPPLAAA